MRAGQRAVAIGGAAGAGQHDHARAPDVRASGLDTRGNGGQWRHRPGLQLTPGAAGVRLRRQRAGAQSGEVVGDRAGRPELTLKLRDEVKWQNKPPVNGRQFTANDVGYTIDYETPDPHTIVLKRSSVDAGETDPAKRKGLIDQQQDRLYELMPWVPSISDQFHRFEACRLRNSPRISPNYNPRSVVHAWLEIALGEELGNPLGGAGDGDVGQVQPIAGLDCAGGDVPAEVVVEGGAVVALEGGEAGFEVVSGVAEGAEGVAFSQRVQRYFFGDRCHCHGEECTRQFVVSKRAFGLNYPN